MGDGFVRVDSAGVSIVTSTAPLASNGWAVGEAVEFVAPVGGGAALRWVGAVVRAVRLSDGRVVVPSVATGGFDVFAPDGQHRANVPISTPDRLRHYVVDLAVLPGDTLVADADNREQVFLLADGTVVRRREREISRYAALMPDGYALGAGTTITSDIEVRRFDPLQSAPGAGRHRDRWALAISGAQNSMLRVIGWFAGREHFHTADDLRYPAIFANNTVFAAGGNPPRIYVGDSATGSINVYDLGGALVRILRDSVPPPAVTPEDFAAGKTAFVNSGARIRTDHIEKLDSIMPPPAHRPAFQALAVSQDGYLFVAGYAPGGASPVVHRIYDPSGVRVGSIVLPGSFDIDQVGDDYVLGTDYGEMFNPVVRMYSLVRPVTR